MKAHKEFFSLLNIGRTLDHEIKRVFFYVNPLNVREEMIHIP